MWVTPAAIASSTRSAGKVFETATSVTSLRFRPARSHAAAIRPSTAARFSAIVTASLHPSRLPAIDCQIREAVGLFIAGAQCVADRKACEARSEAPRFLVQRDEIRMLDSKLAEHLIHQQQRVRDDVHLRGPFGTRDDERFQQTRILRDVVGGGAEEAADLEDLAGVGGHVDAETRW